MEKEARKKLVYEISRGVYIGGTPAQVYQVGDGLYIPVDSTFFRDDLYKQLNPLLDKWRMPTIEEFKKNPGALGQIF